MQNVEDVITAFGKPEDLDVLEKERADLLAERKKQELKESRLLGKIKSLDPFDERFDAMYEALEGVLRQIKEDIAGLDGVIKDVADRIRSAEEGAVSAEKMLRVFEICMNNIDGATPEQQRTIMHRFFDRIEILPVPRPGGQRIRHVRFKFPISLDGGPIDTDHDVYYDDDDDYDYDDDGGDDSPSGGGGPEPEGPDPASGAGGTPPEIDLSDGGGSRSGNCVPNHNRVFSKVTSTDLSCST